MSVFTITISSNNQPIDLPYILKEVDILYEVNKLPVAQLTFVDGNPSTQSFELSNSPHFIPGQEIEIKGRYEPDANSESTIFKGIALKHTVEADLSGSSLTIELKDKAFKMTTVNKNKVYRDQEEVQIFRDLIESNGLAVDQIDDLKGTHQELIQYYCSDWDFLLSRADLFGRWVYVKEGAISVINPGGIDTITADHVFSFGIDNIFNLHLEIDAEKQVDQVSSSSWDIAEQVLTQPVQAASFNTGIGDVVASDVASIVGAGTYTLQSTVPLNTEELQGWSDGYVRRTRLAMIRGSFTVRGIPNIQPLEIMEIAGIGTRFNGKAIISGVRHRVTENGWFTDVQFGIGAQRYVDRHSTQDKPAAGLLPAIDGLQIGIIDTFEADPNEQLRVKVIIPALGPEDNSIWAWLMSPDAGNERGFFFRPETGDEVIVGFLNNDPRQAVVLGAVYSQAIAPPIESDQINENNPVKGIFSREGLQLEMDDENKVLQITTAEDHYIKLDQQEERIEINDVHGNNIKLSSSGIEIISAGDIKIEASGNVEIKGSKVDVK